MDTRFRRHWVRWHALKAEGKSQAAFLAECSDETLVELLADRREGTDVERNVITTELTNRLRRLHDEVARHATDVRGLLDVNERERGERARSESRAEAADLEIGRATDALARSSEKSSRLPHGTDRARDE